MQPVDHLPCPGLEQRLPYGAIPRHRHAAPYAALILQDGYVERGTSGRWRAECGWVVCHHAFEAHDDQVWTPQAWVLNIPLPFGTVLPPMFSVAAPDDLMRAAKQEPQEAHRFLTPLQVGRPEAVDWPDLLAAALQNSSPCLGGWARRMGLAPATVTRGFHAAFGVTPARLRAETRLVRAMRRLVGGTGTLAGIALDCGFSDQAHLSRVILAATGHTPAWWRKVKTVQDGTSMQA